MSSTTREDAQRPLPDNAAAKGTTAGLRFADDRFGLSKGLRVNLNKVFPDHWSFMLGEIALYSFVVLILTGIFLSLFYQASIQEVVYNGSYIPLRGVEMTKAFESTLQLSFDVRGGLLIRQIHHWAALLFVASMSVHLCRIFFTGAFRKPREINWMIGATLLILGILEGFAGYSLPDDLLSGTGLRISFSIVEAIPVVGTWVGFLLFGGNFPGELFIPRLYIIHILLLPGVFLALIGAHMGILWHQKHTDFPGPGKSEHTVVGTKIWPGFAAKTTGFFFIVFGICAFMGGVAQINPIWLYGPYTPANVSAGSQPDWYMGFLDGAVRLMPSGMETNIFGHTLSWNIIIPTLIIPGIIFTGMVIYPWLEAWRTGDHDFHNLLDRPRDRPGRTSLGVMSITFYLILLAAGGNDILATHFSLSINELIWTFRITAIIAPPIAFAITYRICLGLQRKDEEEHHHGIESGYIVRLPHGEFIEIHEPLPTPVLPTVVPVDDGPVEPAELPAGTGRSETGLVKPRRRGGG